MRELVDFRNMPNTGDTEEAIAKEMYSLIAYPPRFIDSHDEKVFREIDAATEIYDWLRHSNAGLSVFISALTLDAVRGRMGYGQFELEWKRITGNDPQNPTKKQVYNYYKNWFGTIFETMNNHTNRTQLCLMRYIVELLKRLEIEKIFDLGGGCGTLSLILDACGFETWYADTPRSYTEAFALSRFSSRNSGINWRGTKWQKEWAGDIICLEVIEHLWNPIEFLVQVTSKMEIGRYFISSESCSDICPPIHLNGNWPFAGKAYIAIMENLGFEYLGGEALIPEKAMGLERYMYQNVLRVFKKVENIPNEVVKWYGNFSVEEKVDE